MKSAVLISLFFGLSAAIAAADAAPLPPEKIDQAVIGSIPAYQGVPAKVLSHLDLTQPFASRSQWTLVVVQDPTPHDDLPSGDPEAPIAICFVKEEIPSCMEYYGEDPDEQTPFFKTTYELLEDKIVYAGTGDTHPVLLIQTCSAHSGDGDCDFRTSLYRYDPKEDRFLPAFVYSSGKNRNEGTKFMMDGPIQGDVILDYPTDDAPYRYWIEVWRPGKTGDYEQALKYRGHTGYNDGNPIPVAWSEMPEILRRLGHWKPGDALPVPPGSDCKKLSLRHGEEWCEQ